MPRDGRSSCTTVYRSVWNCGNGIKRNIAIKILEKSYLQKNLTVSTEIFRLHYLN